MHNDDFANVVGKKPVVLLFATPALCQSRVCGPVTDVAEQVKQEFGDRVAFIHQEIYNNNSINDGPRPQMRAFHLNTEPWAYVIDKSGKVSTVLQGPFSVAGARGGGPEGGRLAARWRSPARASRTQRVGDPELLTMLAAEADRRTPDDHRRPRGARRVRREGLRLASRSSGSRRTA